MYPDNVAKYNRQMQNCIPLISFVQLRSTSLMSSFHSLISSSHSFHFIPFRSIIFASTIVFLHHPPATSIAEILKYI